MEFCQEHAEWTDTLKGAEELTPYAITARYPGEEVEITESEAKRAIDLARQVRSQVRTALEKLGVELPE